MHADPPPASPPAAAEDAASHSRGRILPFHPLLAAAFPVLALYANNLDQTEPRQILRPLALALLGAVIAWAAFGLLTRNARKGAVAATALVLGFFTYGHAVNLVPLELRVAVAPAAGALLFALLVFVWTRRGKLREVTFVLNITALVLVVPAGFTIVSARVAHGPSTVRARLTSRPKPADPPVRPDLPDIYYVILDAYGRRDRMQELYGYDNTPFVRELEKRGFYVAAHSLSNYDQTNLSLASSLNMTYMDRLVAGMSRPSDDPEPLRALLDDNAVAAYLAPLGYHYVYIGSGAGQTRNVTADLRLQAEAPISDFDRHVLGMTALEAVPSVSESQYEARRNYIRSAFQYLGGVARLAYPKFVLAHIFAPHPPFVFGPNGEPVNPKWPQEGEDGSWLLKRMTAQQYRDSYIAQVQFVNKSILKSIDAIIGQSRVPPIIILQGDHGSRLHLDWESLARTDLREPFSILNAYRVPRSVRRHLYDTVTPVNTFRILLSGLFGAKYSPLPDRTFYSTISRPYDFTDVSRRIPGASPR